MIHPFAAARSAGRARLALAVAAVLSGLPMACSSSSPSPSSPTSGTVGTGGGAVSGSGPLAGSQVTVPAGALSGPTAITLQQGSPISQSGFQAAGPAVACGPAGTAFAIPVSVTVPVTVPAGQSMANVVVLKRDAGGVTALNPTSRDATAGTVTVQTASFSDFQAQVPVAATYAGSATGGPGTHKSGNQGEFICSCPIVLSAAVTMSLIAWPDSSVTGTAHAVINGAPVTALCANLVPAKNPDACHVSDGLNVQAMSLAPIDDTQPISGTAADIRWSVSRAYCAGGHLVTGAFEGKLQGNTIVGTVSIAGTCMPQYHWEATGSLPITLSRQ